MNAFERVCDVLDTHHVPYALIGAAALAARGIARSTYDIDLLTTNAAVLDAALWTSFGATAQIRRGDVDDPLAGVVRIAVTGDRPVDVVVGKHGWQALAVERAERVGQGPPIVLARDLVLLKLYAGGTQDLWDIHELLEADTQTLRADVTADLENMSPEMRRRWDASRA